MPTIFALKRLMRSLVASEQLLLFCDLHGHSRKRNIFAYGCESHKGPLRLRERVFPRLLADCAHFSLSGCSYKARARLSAPTADEIADEPRIAR